MVFVDGIFCLTGIVFFIVGFKLSHRIAGPIYRLNKDLKSYVENKGEDKLVIKFRDNDFFQDLKDNVNTAFDVKHVDQKMDDDTSEKIAG